LTTQKKEEEEEEEDIQMTLRFLLVLSLVGALLAVIQLASAQLPCDTLVRCDIGPLLGPAIPLWFGLTRSGDVVFAAAPYSSISVGGGNVTVSYRNREYSMLITYDTYMTFEHPAPIGNLPTYVLCILKEKFMFQGVPYESCYY